MHLLLVGVILTGLTAGALTGREAAADGPYRGRVVDADTKEPLVGAVVLMYWNRLAPGIGHPSETFLGAEETVTDERGEFVIAHDPPRPWTPGTWRSTPHMTIFQPGYQYFPMHFATDAPPPAYRFASLLKVMEERSVTFELPRLHTREERLRVTRRVNPLVVPKEKIPLFMRRLTDELRNFHLSVE